MSNNSQQQSFWKLIQSNKIEIPIIQRDYAQGRPDKKEVRDNFLNDLLNALSKNKPLELDFVYGDIHKGVFQPLDGQQRLTTLFLLHWYVATKEKKMEKHANELSKFTYQTRASSREFCTALATNSGFDLNKLLPPDDNKGNELSKTIIDRSWFFLSWLKDPTIKAMLVMLDAIHKKFNPLGKEINLWGKLTEQHIITFHHLTLEGFGLSEDLYIKMNARGKALTPFENFKARFEKHIKKCGFEKDLELSEKNKEKWKELTEKTFAHKIDTVWTDLFWSHRDDENKIDNRILKFIASIAILGYAQNKEIFDDKKEHESIKKELEIRSKSMKISDDEVKRERIERRILKLFNDYNEIKPEDFSSKEAFTYLKRCFEIYCKNKNDKFFPELILWNYVGEKEKSLFILSTDVTKQTSYKQRVLFYAQTVYLQTVSENTEAITEWLRVVRNIVENSVIDSATTFIAAIDLIQEISVCCYNIFGHLSSPILEIKAGHAKEQIKEEIEKSKIMIENPQAKQIIHETEDTNFCKGKIDFALYCIDYNIESKNKIFCTKKLEGIQSVITTNFPDLNEKLSDDFKRAFLTIKDGNYYNVRSYWSYSFNSHKKWLMSTVNDLNINFSKSKDWKRDSLKELFVALLSKDFSEIISQYHIPEDYPKWKKRLIKEPNLFEGATFVLIPTDNSYCKLAWQQKPSKEYQVKTIE